MRFHFVRIQLKVWARSLVSIYIHIGTQAKVRKGVWRMPRLTEAMKDVISCDKPWGGANDL